MNDTETDRGCETARDSVEFLVSSWNRLDVLDAAASAPRTRNELRDTADVSRVTLSRILSDLEAQGWIARDGDVYEATRAGAFVAAEVGRVLENVETLNRLEDNVEWIRLDQFDFDLCRLRDAELITPSWDDFSAQTRRLVDLVYECTAIRGIGTGMDREFMRAVGDAAIDGDLAVELVFEPAVVDAINSEPGLTRLFRDLSDAEDATVYRYRGHDPLMELGIHETQAGADDVVMLCGEYDEGAPPGTVRTTDPKVRSWAESYFESRRGESHRLRAAVFTP